jgi:Protein of unknown function (DUF2637)
MNIQKPHIGAARVASAGFATVLLAVEGVIVAESWRGLTGFAWLIGITGAWSWGVPVTLDGVSLAAAFLALRAELSGEASGVYRATLFVFTAASAAANGWHALRVGGIEAALYLAGMSLAVTWVFSLVLRQIRVEDRRAAGRTTGRLPRFSAAHWLRFPRLTGRAWSLAVRDGHETARAALEAAITGQSAPLPEVPAELADLPKAEAIRIALAHCNGSVTAAQKWLADHGVTVDRAYAHDVKAGRSGRRRAKRAEVAVLGGPRPAIEARRSA